MKKIVLAFVASLALSATSTFAADMPVKAVKAPAAAPSPWDIAFGAAFTTDYELRGVSQSNHRPAAQGYFELDYTATDWLKLYAGVWGSSVAGYLADAEIDPLLMMRPPCGACDFMRRMACCAHRNEPVRLTATTALHCSNVRSSSGTAGALEPALLNSTSKRPNVSFTRWNNAATASGCAISVGATSIGA